MSAGRAALIVVRQRGTVDELHGRDPFAGGDVVEPRLLWCEPVDTAVVLGSRQSPDLLDLAACAALGVVVAHRRSGGGMVLIVPEDVVWIDIVLPHGVAPDDVRGSMVWIGERWRDALTPFVPDGGRLTVHTGPSLATAWSDLVCFAGVGPGEVLLDGRKLVGLSQRRTRHGLRVQGLVHRRPPAIDITALLRAPTPSSPLPDPAWLDPLDVATLVERLTQGR